MFLLSATLPGCGKLRKKDAAFEPGGDWVTTMRAHIQESVSDPDRATGMLAVVDSVEADLAQLDAEVLALYEDIRTLDANAESTRNDFDAALSRFDALRDDYRHRFLNSMFEMKELATRQEWEKLSDLDKTLYEQWQRPFEL
jgi:hypothetical protein